MMISTIYLANGLGFSATTSSAVDTIKARLQEAGLHVYEPFSESKDLGEKIAELGRHEKNMDILKRKLADINKTIGQRNIKAIDAASAIVAILDGGLELDSGVAAEIGYAAGRGKKVLGYRTDFRCSGENPGATINIQVEFFLKLNGGAIFNDIEFLLDVLKT